MSGISAACSNRRTLALTVTFLFTAAVSTALAQTPPNTELVVFQLEHVDAKNAANIVNELLGGPGGVRCIPDGSQRLVVMGTDDQLETIRVTLENLDVGSEETKIRVFALKYVTSDNAAQVLRSLGLRLSIAADIRTNSLIVQGPVDQLSVVEELLVRLDQSSAPRSGAVASGNRYRLDVVWLMEGPSDPSIVLREPVQLAGDAIREIEGQGFLEVLQAGQVSVAVRSGGRFTVQSNALLGRIEVAGLLNSAPDGKLELQLSIDVSKNDTQLVSVSTEIITEPGHDVVLGIAGAVLGMKERRSALVVRITE